MELNSILVNLFKEDFFPSPLLQTQHNQTKLSSACKKQVRTEGIVLTFLFTISVLNSEYIEFYYLQHILFQSWLYRLTGIALLTMLMFV